MDLCWAAVGGIIARLITSGFETRSFKAADLTTDPDGKIGGGTVPVLETSVVRSGSASAKCVVVNNTSYVSWSFTLGASVFARAYMYFNAYPTGDSYIMTFLNAADPLVSVRVTSAGDVYLYNHVTLSQVGTTLSGAILLNTWHRVELSSNISNGKGAYIDGVEVQQAVAISNNADSVRIGAGTTGAITASLTCYLDDVAINDDTPGTTQTGFPGTGKIVLLRPLTDSALASWTDGIGGTGNLADAVDNEPPIGIAVGSATAGSQIKNTAASADNYDVICERYDTIGGISQFDTIAVVQPIANLGTGGITARSNQVSISANPVVAAASLNTPAAAAGTYPTNWKWLLGTIAYLPSVTIGSGPTLRLTKNNTSIDASMFDFGGVYVEYNPAYVAQIGPPPLIGQ